MELPLHILKEWTLLPGPPCSLGKAGAQWRFVVVHFHTRPGNTFVWFCCGHHLSEAQRWDRVALLMVRILRVVSNSRTKECFGGIIIMWALNWVKGKKTPSGCWMVRMWQVQSLEDSCG